MAATSEDRCPGAKTAEVSDDKLFGYLLNPDPTVSRGKRAFFEGLGFNEANAEELRREFLSGLPDGVVNSSRPNNGGGTNYEVRLTIKGPKASAEVRTIWSNTTGTTSLVTAYPSREKQTTTTLQL